MFSLSMTTRLLLAELARAGADPGFAPRRNINFRVAQSPDGWRGGGAWLCVQSVNPVVRTWLLWEIPNHAQVAAFSFLSVWGRVTFISFHGVIALYITQLRTVWNKPWEYARTYVSIIFVAPILLLFSLVEKEDLLMLILQSRIRTNLQGLGCSWFWTICSNILNVSAQIYTAGYTQHKCSPCMKQITWPCIQRSLFNSQVLENLATSIKV